MGVSSAIDGSRDADEANRYVVPLDQLDRTQIALAGGKAAHLGELTRLDGVRVPAGFCVTTDAFRRVIASGPAIEPMLERLSQLTPDDHDAIRALSDELRRTIEEIAIPEDLVAAITRAHAQLGEDGLYAVRSSATAEDSPTTSFAGLQDSYLDVSSREAILQHVRRCWTSLFTERAVTYRLRNGIAHQRMLMAVIVQRMVAARAAGVLFTADPVTGNRTVTSIEAALGLGEPFVSGHVNADTYKVREGAIAERTVGTRPVLTDDEVVRLAALGRMIEAHFGRPQDVEWCLADEGFHIVQSRPITSLFPIPAASDGARHVYLSVGHQQMMTDAMTPLGLSVWRMIAAAQMHEAGGRLFVDVSRALASPAGRAGLLAMARKSDVLTADALETIVAREFIPTVADAPPSESGPRAAAAPIETDSSIVEELIARGQTSIAALMREIVGHAGPDLFDFIESDVMELKRIAFDPRSTQAIMAGMEATWWLNDRLEAWLGEKNAADTLALSVDRNVTSEMGLALLRVADAIRPHPEVVALLEHATDDDFLNALPGMPGGRDAYEAIVGWLDRYGMRCVGEIDITRPRWRERPAALLPLILHNVRHFETNAGDLRFEEGRRAAHAKKLELLAGVRALPDGAEKAGEVERMIDRLRTFTGYREYPKYFIISRLFVYKQALLNEVERLARAGVLRDREDAFFLTFEELREAVRTRTVDHERIRNRRDDFVAYQRLTPPRVLTSEGEVLNGAYRRDGAPPGALVGIPVSAGTVEGRARIVFDVANAKLEPGDILVTTFTDPSWTPLFVAIRGLVTEVGGVMTHGAVIAREYGLPAVVGVEHATRRIRDGQRIRVHGREGYVEILS